MATDVEAPAKKKGLMGLLVWVVLAVVAASAGASLPWIIGGKHPELIPVKKVESPPDRRITALPFDTVVVNLDQKNLNRFLRVKLLVAVDEADAKEMTELLTKQRAFLKNWLITYLFSQSFEEVGRRSGINRIGREIRDQFNAMLYPNGEEKVVEILFDEFVVQ